MKKIVLKVNDLNLDTPRLGKLEHASFHAVEGEVAGLLGLNDSGRELAVRVLLGSTELDWQENCIYVDGEKIEKAARMRRLIYHMDGGSPGIAGWTVAEYVGIRDVGWLLTGKVKRKLRGETEEQFARIGIQMDINKKIRELNELERRAVELVRARKTGARILVIEDECQGMNPEDIRSYRRLLERAVRGRMAAVLLCHSELASAILSDRYIIFRKGRIVKKCRKENLGGNGSLSAYLLGNSMTKKKRTLDSYARKVHAGEDVVYGVRNLPVQGEWEDFDFRRGEITTFALTDNRERLRFFLALCGRNAEEGVGYVIGGERRYRPGLSVFIENRIVSLMKLGGDYETFEKMSVGDNLLLPLLGRLPGRDYFLSGGKIARLLCRELDGEGLHSGAPMDTLNTNEHINVALGRWYMFNPQVIVLYEPFASCDAYGVSVIMSYIKKFSNRGTAVIVVKSNLEYMETVSDRIFDLAL